MPSLENKIVVITGASRGVGAAAARLFAANSASVVLAGRDQERLIDVARSLHVPADRYEIVVADLGRRDGMAALVNAALARFGRIDIFINNAGLGVRKPITDTAESEWDLIFDINVKAVYFSFLELIPHFRTRGHGHIINVSSMASLTGRPTLGAYAASKAALNILSEAVGEELRNENIKVSLLQPGSIATEFLSRVTEDQNPSSPNKPRMTPEQVAAKIVELAREDHAVWTSRTQMRPLHTK